MGSTLFDLVDMANKVDVQILPCSQIKVWKTDPKCPDCDEFCDNLTDCIERQRALES